MDADTELMRQFRAAIGAWPPATKLAFLQGRITLEEAMEQARLLGAVETVDYPANK